MLHIFTQVILPFMMTYKYLAIFVVTLLAAFIVPIPPGTMIMASSALAFEGYFKLGLVMLFAILGKMCGDSLNYYLSHRFGYPVLSKIGFRKILNSDRYKSVEEKIKTRPGLILFLSRFEITINLIVNIISGLGKIPYGKFLLFTTIGEMAQVIVYSLVGYFFGGSLETIRPFIGSGSLTIIVIIVVIYLLYRSNKKARESK